MNGARSGRYGDFRWLRSEIEDLSALLDTVAAHDVFGLSAGAAGRVPYDIVGTQAAPVTSGQSMTAEPMPGAFRLQAFDMRSGQDILDRPLPAWYGSSGGTLAAVDSPPEVVGVTDRTVLVSPDASEADPIEAFPTVSVALAHLPGHPRPHRKVREHRTDARYRRAWPSSASASTMP